MHERVAARLVCAVVHASAEEAVRALGVQTLEPQAVVTGRDSLGTMLQRAFDSGAEWIWILDGSAAPRPDALGKLMDAFARTDGLAQPDVLTGVVRTADGRLDEDRGLWYCRTHTEPAMAAARRRLLPIRATAGPALVHCDALRAVPPRRRTALAPAGVLDVTARILRSRTGYLVPESESETVEPTWVGGPSTAARLILGGAFTGLDRARIGYELLWRSLSGAGSESPRPTP